MPSTHHVVVDGSNLATEGRSVPSLAQLDEAVRSYLAEDPGAQVVVVVDASFGHRIDPSERAQLEAAELHGELVAPPAGAIGRGDAFVLRIAERTGATVLSNDSFQEFHEEHPWLFDDGRLIGGKPVPGVGWIFTPRRPVRGPRSRKARDREDVEQNGLSAARKAAEVAKALRKQDAKAAAPANAVAKMAEVKRARKRPAEQGAGETAAVGVKKVAKARTKKSAEVAVPATPAVPATSAVPKAKAVKKAETKKAAKKLEGTGAKKALARSASKGEPAKAVKKAAAKRAASTKKAAATKAPDTKAAKGAKAAKQVKAAKRPSAASTRQTGLKAAIHRATKEVLHPEAEPSADGAERSKPKRRRRAEPPAAVNAPLTFINFVAAHPVGSSVEGVVSSFTSHGAMVDVRLGEGDVLHCYAPLTGLGSPPPRAARDVLQRGERRTFALVSLDPPRRMAELALPEFAPAPVGTVARGPRAG